MASPAFWLIGFAVLVGWPIARAVRRALPDAPPVLATVPSFSLRDQDGRPFGTADLASRAWVASAVATRCGPRCAPVTRRMVEVQHRTRNLPGAFRLVSFAVEPEHDTPEVLREFARAARASPRAWSFLTGDREMLEPLRGVLQAGEGAGGPGDRIALVDGKGRIRGYYGVEGRAELERLLRDVGAVVAGR